VAGKGVERRLAAIMSADVAGYSRLMGKDEAGTLAALKALRREVFAPQVAAHNGRIVKLMGDGALVEFPSIVQAVDCAVMVQRGLAGRNADPAIKLRIGINLGDIIIEGTDIYGDGVNVAARIQEVAEPGGIALSGAAFDQVAGKVEATFADGGEHELKNITKPVRVWRWSDDVAAAPGGAAPLAIPDKPSIAVLPFTNMSGDPEQEYFSDGITEDIITELSRFHSLFVIARNSSFAYKGLSVNVGKIGQELGVAYVVEGSVRKAGNRVRITAQLVEAESGNHVWAERYDRELEDIFAVQDEVVGSIAGAVPGRLGEVAVERARNKPAENMTAYDYVLRGDWYRERDLTDPNALAMYEKAIAADPRCARAYAEAAEYHAYSVWGHGAPPEDARPLARSFIEQALALDENDPRIQAMAATTYIEVGEHDLARRHVERAFTLNPNDALIMWNCGLVLAYLGDHDEALQWHRRALRVDPYFVDGFREPMFEVNYMARRYDEAIALFRGWRSPAWHMYLGLAAAYAQLGQMDEAREALERVYRSMPETVDLGQTFFHNDLIPIARQEDRDHWLEGYRKAGLDV
jgi:TolB-like protein/class 3 adenylate cyclase/tetratricopeptide (TPR) repeat protein